jgi:hypothetical protein
MRAESERAEKMNIFCDSADLFSASFTPHACSKEIIKLGKESMFYVISLNSWKRFIKISENSAIPSAR